MKFLAISVFVAVLGLTGCSKSSAPASGPLATVSLKDGSTFSGNVTKSDANAITLQSSTGESRTYPMTQVSTVQYGDSPVPSASTVLAPPSPAPAPAASAAVPRPVEYTRSAPRSTPSAAPPARPEMSRTISTGTTIQLRNNEAINSETASVGQTFSAVVAQDVLDTEGRVAIPRGSDATLVIKEAVSQGKIEGKSELVLDVGSVSVGGRTYRLETSDLVEKGKDGLGKNKRSAIFVGGGSALGGLIGGLAGGGKGAAIGALSGAAAGTATQAVTRGKGVRVPSETILNFRLEAPVRIR
jgi:hypothetical protein